MYVVFLYDIIVCFVFVAWCFVPILSIAFIVFLVVLGTQDLTFGVLQELDLVGRRSNPLSEHNLSQVLSRGVVLICSTEVETENIDTMRPGILSLISTY